jgi:microcystin-dependent protein
VPYLTPEAAAGDYLRRRLRIPVEMVPIVTGALIELTHEWNYEPDGDMTPAEAAELMITMLNDYLDEGGTDMIGVIVVFATQGPPYGVLECDGSSYDRIDYPALYAALDAIYQIDADTFSVPDLRGRTVIGVGAGSGLTARAIADTGGEETHQLTEAELPSHTHQWTDPGLILVTGGIDPLSAALADPGNPFSSVGNTGGDEPHENMPPFHALRYGIIAL